MSRKSIVELTKNLISGGGDVASTAIGTATGFIAGPAGAIGGAAAVPV